MDHNKLWKIHNEMGIPDQLTCLLRNLYAGQEATVRTEHGNTHTHTHTHTHVLNQERKKIINQEKSTTRLYAVTLLI